MWGRECPKLFFSMESEFAVGSSHCQLMQEIKIKIRKAQKEIHKRKMKTKKWVNWIKCMWRAFKRQSPKKGSWRSKSPKKDWDGLVTACAGCSLRCCCPRLLPLPMPLLLFCSTSVSFCLSPRDKVSYLELPWEMARLFPWADADERSDAAFQNPQSFDGFTLILAAAELAELAAESSKLLTAAAAAELATFWDLAATSMLYWCKSENSRTWVQIWARGGSNIVSVRQIAKTVDHTRHQLAACVAWLPWVKLSWYAF